MEYGTAYEWWKGKHADMLDWVVSDDGRTTLGDIVKALHDYRNCLIAIVEPEFKICRYVISRRQ